MKTHQHTTHLSVPCLTPQAPTQVSHSMCLLRSCFSHVQLCATLWSVALQAPLSMGILQARAPEWVACPPPGDSSQAREGTCISDVS